MSVSPNVALQLTPQISRYQKHIPILNEYNMSPWDSSSATAEAAMFSTPLHSYLRFFNMNSRGQASIIYRVSDPQETLSNNRGWILTGIDYGVHLQDRDVSFVEGHFITQASSASHFLSVLLLIVWKRTKTMETI